MTIKRFFSLIGATGLTVIFVIAAAKLPVIAATNRLSQTYTNHLPSSADDLVYSTATTSTLSCREGLAGWEPYLSSGIDIQALGGGVYLDFGAHHPAPQPNAMEFIQIIRVHQNKDNNGNYLSSYTTTPPLSDATGGLGPIVTNTPGALWVIGNEPDRGPDFPGGIAQDATYPAVYARVYHDAYEFIKQRDPTAQVAVAGLVEVTPGRLQYLDIAWATYAALYGTSMPVDVWNMHIYILPEIPGIANVALGTDPSIAYGFAYTHTSGEPNLYTYGDHDRLTIFDSQVRRMRQWMKNHGQEDKPLLLSEFGLLYDEGVTDEFGVNYTMPRAATFLTKTFSYLATTRDSSIGMPSDNNRLVQQWVWFSTNYSLGHISNLVSDTIPLTFTSVGKMFQASVSSRLLTSNLLPRSVIGTAPLLTPGNSSVTATLSVQLVNNGNRLVTMPMTVTFYSNAALTQVIDSAVVMGDIPGCARRRVSVSAVWPNLGVGIHPYWVKVDSANTVVETNETDNVIAGQVFVGTQQLYLPLIAKTYR